MSPLRSRIHSGKSSAVLESGVIGFVDREGLTKPLAYVVLKNRSEACEKLPRN
jgi:acyl-coenzyme A synthetase/AMP-(fatty) acid ligase